MNLIDKSLHWMEVLRKLYNSKAGVTGYMQGKHRGGTIPSPHADAKRIARNKRQRQARQQAYKRN